MFKPALLVTAAALAGVLTVAPAQAQLLGGGLTGGGAGNLGGGLGGLTGSANGMIGGSGQFGAPDLGGPLSRVRGAGDALRDRAATGGRTDARR